MKKRIKDTTYLIKMVSVTLLWTMIVLVCYMYLYAYHTNRYILYKQQIFERIHMYIVQCTYMTIPQRRPFYPVFLFSIRLLYSATPIRLD